MDDLPAKDQRWRHTDGYSVVTMRYEHSFVSVVACLACIAGHFDGTSARPWVSASISTQSEVYRVQTINRDSILPVSGADSIELAPKIDSVVRGIVINYQLFRLDGPHARGLDDIRQGLYGTGILVGPAHHSNNHGEHWSICYEARSPTDSMFMLLWSDPEMGGPTHDLQGFELGRRKPTNASCTPIPVRNQVTTDNGLYLGMALADVQKIMGKPKKVSTGVYTFEYHRTVRTYDPRKIAAQHETFDKTKNKPPYVEYDITASLDVRVSNGSVVGLEASYVESY